MAKPQPNAVMQILPVIVTILVVVGALVLARTSPPSSPAAPLTSGLTSVAPTALEEMTIVSQSGKTLFWSTASSSLSRCDLPDGFSFVDRVTTEGVMAHNAEGAHEVFTLQGGGDCVAKHEGLPAGVQSPSNKRTARLADARSDGASVLQIVVGADTNEITLRGKNSRPYQDAQVIGWLSDEAIVLTVTQGDTKIVLLVETTGRVSELLKLPENAAELAVGGRAVWYVTYTPGEGIEQGPRGPSELHRVTDTGADALVSTEDRVVIERVMVGAQGSVAYVAGDTTKLVNATGTVFSVDKGRALGWTDEGDLLVDRQSLWAYSSEGVGRELSADELAPAASAAWVVHWPLDAASANK